MPPKNLDEVLVELDDIVADALQKPSRLGLFAALYRAMTAKVKQGLVEGRFADAARMDRFDTTFASRYLAAYAAYRAGQPCSRSWKVAFRAADDPSLICLQHLLLGMNAHINLDLAVAAVEVCPGPALPKLQADFDAINDILSDLLDDIQAAINGISPLFHVLDVMGGGVDEHLASFSLVRARHQAWQSAKLLSRLPATAQPHLIEILDGMAAGLGRLLVRPDPLRLGVLSAIRRLEPDDIPVLIHAIRLAG